MGLLSRATELLTFNRGPLVWRYALGDRAVVYQGQTYVAWRGLRRTSRLARTADPEQSALEIAMPYDVPVLAQFAPIPAAERIGATLLQLRAGESVARVRWTGSVAKVSLGRTEATVKCRAVMTDMAALGLIRNWQRVCGLVVYGAGLGECNAPMEAFRVDGTVIASEGVTLQAAAWGEYPDTWFDGGEIRWQTNGATERRFVVAHVGTTLTLLTPAAIPEGTSVPAYPGCDHTKLGANGCGPKFGNIPNFGGQERIPEKNPMGSDEVF